MPKTNFAADFRVEKSQEGLRRKRNENDRRRPVKLGPRILILKIVVFEARRRLLHPHFGLGSKATNKIIKNICVTSEPEMRVKVKESSARELQTQQFLESLAPD